MHADMLEIIYLLQQNMTFPAFLIAEKFVLSLLLKEFEIYSLKLMTAVRLHINIILPSHIN